MSETHSSSGTNFECGLSYCLVNYYTMVLDQMGVYSRTLWQYIKIIYRYLHDTERLL